MTVTVRDHAVYLCRRLAWNALTRLNGGRELHQITIDDLDPPLEDVEFVERWLRAKLRPKDAP